MVVKVTSLDEENPCSLVLRDGRESVAFPHEVAKAF